ncbi:MAG: hypothetical protein A3E94_00875 [Candidatus Zambryskibacteria bacterium RIFCSPHIGHO2_12_FULL_44_12b]|nr:MAG: hypothetical protein A3E94_00875 [Candidatus Zambryskibacteria bacterium RIFCSPHIGHO2_12_FULL_44_12b]
MKKNLIITIVLILVFLSLLYFGKGNKTAVLPVDNQIKSGSLLNAGETKYDFGLISMKDGVVKRLFTVSNDTANDVRVDSVVTSCMCTNAYIVNGEDKRGPFGMPGHGNTVPKANEIIKTGEKRVIEVVFDPAAHGPEGVGVAERYVYLVDEKGGALQLEIKAEVTL